MSGPLTRNGETVLLTGATGYVGSVVAEKLCKAGYVVRGLTRSERKAPILEAAGIEPIVGDVGDIDLMAEAAAGVNAIVHTAAPNAPVPGESMAQIIAGAARAVELAADLAATNNARLIVTSGVSLYGPTGGRVVDETAPLQTPPFAAPLAEAETTFAERGRAYVLRLGVVYGRDQSAPMRALIDGVRERGAPVMIDHANRLSVAHVDDLADLYTAILEADAPPTVVNGVTAILTWPRVMDAVATAAGISAEPETITAEEAGALGGPAIYMAMDMAVSGELARRTLGWLPKAPDFETDLTRGS